MRIGELAEKTGLAPSAIRFYEQSGLLPAPARSANGYRVYSDAAVGRLRMVQLAQNLGFPLDKLREAMAIAGGHENCSQDDLLNTLNTRLEEIEQLMTALRAQRKTLRTIRDTLSETWAAGHCVDDVELLNRLLAEQQEMPRRSKRNGR